MDDTPRATDRWLPALCISLIVEGVAVAVVTTAPYWVHQVIAIAAGATGIVTLLNLRRPERRDTWGTAGFACVGLAVLLGIGGYEYLTPLTSGVRSALGFFGLPAMVLIGAGGPLFWASALAQREQPEHARLAQLGRIGAGLAQLGFVFAFAQEIPSIGRIFQVQSPPGASLLPLHSITRLIARILLLGASVQMMRSGADPEILAPRFATVHRLMVSWALALIANSVVLFALDRTEIHYFLRGLVQVTMTLVAAFTLARRFRTLPREAPAEA